MEKMLIKGYVEVEIPTDANEEVTEDIIATLVAQQGEGEEDLFDDVSNEILGEIEDESIEDEETSSYESDDDEVVPDATRAYLLEIAKNPLLTMEEEQAIGQRILRGRADGATEADIRDAEKAKSELVTHNLRLVVSVAKKHLNRGLPLLDLIQEGNIGLMKGAEKFNPSLGYKFSTYAHWWIRQNISRSLSDSSRTIRIPAHLQEVINKMIKISKKMEQEKGQEPSVEEIAQAMDMKVSKLVELQKIASEPASLDTPIGEKKDTSLGDMVEDTNSMSPETALYMAALKDVMKEALDSLSPREKSVLMLRYGINARHRPYTLDEIAAKFGLTRERIRQIEAESLRKLRHPMRAKKFHQFLSENGSSMLGD